MMGKGIGERFGRISAKAFKTPTWYAPRAPPPDRMRAVFFGLDLGKSCLINFPTGLGNQAADAALFLVIG